MGAPDGSASAKRAAIGAGDEGVALAAFHHPTAASAANLHAAVGPHLHVRGLEVAMHDPLLVRGFESFRDLLRDGEGFVERYRAARNAL